MRLCDFIHPQIRHIDDEPLQRQSRVDRLDHDSHPPRPPLLHLLPEEGDHLGDILPDLWMAGLIHRHAVCAAAGECGGRVDLADAEDGVDCDLDCGREGDGISRVGVLEMSGTDGRKEVRAFMVSGAYH